MALKRMRWSLRRWRPAIRRYHLARSWCYVLRPAGLASVIARLELACSDKTKAGAARLNSRVSVRDPLCGEEAVFILVEPARARPEQGVISILSPLGDALLGSRPGDLVRPRFLGRGCDLLVVKVEAVVEAFPP
ncbi:hypothetical protein CEK62_03580 [Alcanivorax sp. N3-2A]|nr:hypothetical protein CEK62_03580 [Alcanivorax sp. N3-2A]